MAKKAAKPAVKAEKVTKPAKAEKPAKKAASPEPVAKAKPKTKPEVSADVSSDSEPVATLKTVVAKAPAKEKPKKISAKAKAEAAESAESNKKWNELKEKHSAEKPVSYNMTGVFTAHTPIQHKIFGWGFIVNSENDRLEVLFETGTKHLISNYKR